VPTGQRLADVEGIAWSELDIGRAPCSKPPAADAGALRKLHQSGPLKEVLGKVFVEVPLAVKQAEHDAYQQVISSWEREHPSLNV
jgi:glutamine synthetase